MYKMALLISLLLTINTSAKYLPDNDLIISENSLNKSTISEVEFNSIIKEINNLYKPLIERKRLSFGIYGEWHNDAVNAMAFRGRSFWSVKVFGGLARHPLVTRDGLRLVICHEIGHHIGGAPRIGLTRPMASWASVEGQADYFANAKCLKRVFSKDENIEVIKDMNINPLIKNSCDEVYSDLEESAICQRSTLAGISMAKVLASISKVPPIIDISKPSLKVVKKTNKKHPHPQCRLDTYFQASLCDKTIDQRLGTNPNSGACTIWESYKYGKRPTCWYKPKK
jgi:hypothetical protein